MKSQAQDANSSKQLDRGQRIDAICDAFEAQWIAGWRPVIDDFLGRHADEDQASLLQELVALEVDYRRKAGEQPSPEEYASRFGDSAVASDEDGAERSNRSLDLVANGPAPEMNWRRSVPPGRTIRLGRAPNKGWPVPWDLRVSREHADLVLQQGQLTITCIESARNATSFKGQRVRQFTIRPGQSFRIGETIFRLEHSAPKEPIPQEIEDRPVAGKPDDFLEDTHSESSNVG